MSKTCWHVPAIAFAVVAGFILTKSSDVIKSPKEWDNGVFKNARNDVVIPILKDSREVLKKKSANGECAHKETILGVCRKHGTCMHRAHRSIISCLDCPDSEIHKSKLDTQIIVKTKLVASLDKGSHAYTVEKHDLTDLIVFRDKRKSNDRSKIK